MTGRVRRAAWVVVPVLASAGVVVATAWALGSAPLIGRGGADGPVLTSDDPGLVGGGTDAIVEGTVDERDGCLLLRSGAQEVAVLWPHGTSWDEDAGGVRVSGGGLARRGERVSGGGGFLQVGDRLAGQTAVQAPVLDELLRCAAVAGAPEVAVFNAGSEVTAP